MAVSYLSIGTELDASHWNDLYSELDAKVCNAVNSQSIVLWGQDISFGAIFFAVPGDVRYSRRFYFTDRTFLTNPSASLANQYMATQIYTDYDTFNFGSPTLYQLDNRVYEHQPFTDAVDAATLFTGSGGDCRHTTQSTWPVVIVNGHYDSPTSFDNAYATAVWPDTGADVSGNPIDKFSLDWSLEAHKKTVDGLSYYVFVNGPYFQLGKGVEYTHVWQGAEIIIGDGSTLGGLTVGSESIDWPDSYDIYRFFRFNNLRSSDFTINFSNGLSVTLPPLTSKCVRRVGAEYIEGGNYFQKTLAGDPWFLNPSLAVDSLAWNNTTDCLCGAAILPNATEAAVVDMAQCQDISDVYCNPSKTAQPFEFPMPAGGWFASPSDLSKPIGDFIIQKGDLLVVDPSGPFLVHSSQSFTVDGSMTHHLLRKKDGTIALGTFSSSFQVFSGSTEILQTNSYPF